MLARRATREIAIYNEGRLDARIEADREHHGRVERALAEGQAGRERQHAENRADTAALNLKLDTAIADVHDRITAVVWKIVGWQSAVIFVLLSAALAGRLMGKL